MNNNPAWIPTPALRFVERDVPVPSASYGGHTVVKKVRILQQRWVSHDHCAEWRDVPLEAT